MKIIFSMHKSIKFIYVIVVDYLKYSERVMNKEKVKIKNIFPASSFSVLKNTYI